MSMLDEITATNLGLIESARIQVGPGLTVITGETGTGKTLMLGALRLVRGDKAGKGYVGPAGDSCEVAARFTEGEDETVVRRTIDGSRSRAYVNDTATSVAGLVESISGDIAIVGQHDQLTITSTRGVRALLDRSFSSGGKKAHSAYSDAWEAYQGVMAELEAIGSDIRGLERDRDML
ncbi:MAG: AAA family ATPase, partial [Acidimicrobiia bacterium]